MARIDASGAQLSGAHAYTLRFPPGQLPPARYWRISIYDLEGFFVNNVADRYGIGNMAEDLALDPGGGLTIRIQHQQPDTAEDRTNWLPAPHDGFFLVMRLYQPEPRIYTGEYTLPPLTRDLPGPQRAG
jgi:hypothetical protein